MNLPSFLRRAKAPNIHLTLSDITHWDQMERKGAIVNAANEIMLGGGGVDGAIHRAAGPSLLSECERVMPDSLGRRCPIGHAQITGAGNLNVDHVVHTVGPRYSPGNNDQAGQLRSAYMSAIATADAAGCDHVVLPSISTGIFSYPLDEAAGIAVTAIRDLRLKNVRNVYFALFDENTMTAFQAAVKD